jgi:iron complex outermembrane recepter protein
LYVDVASFYNVYNDLEGYGPAGLAESGTPPNEDLFFTLPYANVIKGHTDGIEIAPDWKVADWWHLRGSYSYLHMSLTDMPGYTDVGGLLSTYIGSSPSHLATFQSQFNLPKHFEFDPTYRYSSQLPEFGVHPYSTADVRFGWQAGEGFDFSIVGQNLTRPNHAEFGGDPGPLVGIKRAVYGKITWVRR